MPVQGKTRHEVLSEFRCAEILTAARKVFARKGFEGATVDEIAEAAKLAKGTVYLYFSSKRQIFLDAVQQGVAGLAAQTMREMEAASGPREKVRAFIATRIRYAEENREFVKLYHSVYGSMIHPVQVGKDLRALYLQQAKILEQVIADAVAAGEIRPLRADTAAIAIYEATRGFVTQRLLGMSKAGVDEDIEFLFELIWKGVAPAAE